MDYRPSISAKVNMAECKLYYSVAGVLQGHFGALRLEVIDLDTSHRFPTGSACDRQILLRLFYPCMWQLCRPRWTEGYLLYGQIRDVRSDFCDCNRSINPEPRYEKRHRC